MDSKGRWVKIAETQTSVTYEKQIPPSKGSCIVALILLCFFILPGILYLYYTNKPASVERIYVELLSDGTIKGSGTPGGMNLYYSFNFLNSAKAMLKK